MLLTLGIEYRRAPRVRRASCGGPRRPTGRSFPIIGRGERRAPNPLRRRFLSARLLRWSEVHITPPQRMAVPFGTLSQSVRRRTAASFVYDGAHGCTLMISSITFLFFASYVAGGSRRSDALSSSRSVAAPGAGIIGPLIGSLAMHGRPPYAARSIGVRVQRRNGRACSWHPGRHARHHVDHRARRTPCFPPVSTTPTYPARSRLITLHACSRAFLAAFLLLGRRRVLLSPYPFTNTYAYGTMFETRSMLFVSALFLLAVIGCWCRGYLAAPPIRSTNYDQDRIAAVLATIRAWRHDRSVPSSSSPAILVNNDIVTALFTALTFRSGCRSRDPGADAALRLVALPATIFFGWATSGTGRNVAANIADHFVDAVLGLVGDPEDRKPARFITLAAGS